MEKHLESGQVAPRISVSDHNGNPVAVGGDVGHKTLVYFYPKADTPGCTKQSCGLRDLLGDIGDTVVVGVSPDAPDKQAKFDNKYGLGFPLLSDEDHSISEAYGVWGERSMYGKKYMGITRSAFLVDEKGTLEEVWYKISPDDTPKNLLKALSK